MFQRYFIRLKDKWEIETNQQLAVIFLVFALTGSSAMLTRKLFFQYIQLDLATIQVPYNYLLRIGVTLFFYKILLLIFGRIFGQFTFFWNFEKRIFGRFNPKKLISKLS
ncbi:MAG: diacylglyceryl transferase [Chitinophagales bacterium]|nr:diacylglyceryl transferase [Chitinophagales bacterium]